MTEITLWSDPRYSGTSAAALSSSCWCWRIPPTIPSSIRCERSAP